MDLRQLRSFLAVVDHGSFSAAADALFTVQSNVSTHVARLETELGNTLLDRRSRLLTPAGRVVEERARAIMAELAAIGQDIASLEDRIIGQVTCGATPSIGLRVIPPTLAQASRTLPEVSITVVEAHSGTLVQQLIAGDLDLAITTGANNPELRSTPLFAEDIVAVVSNTHPLAAREAVTLDELASHKLLLPLPDNPLYDHIFGALVAASGKRPSSLAVGSSALVQAMAAAHVGIAVIPATAASDRHETGDSGVSVKAITGLGRREVALTMRRDVVATRALEAVAALIEETARQAVQTMAGCHPMAHN